MKNFIRYLVSFAACLAVVGSVADDGGLIVMDRAYYESCKATFYGNCNALSASVNADYLAIRNFLYQRNDELSDIQDMIGDARYNCMLIANDIPPGSETFGVNYYRAQQAYEQLDSAYTEISNVRNSIAYELDDLDRMAASLNSQIAVVSNSFPLAVTATNLELNVYVIVTNNFDVASNLFDNAENSYTNFLAYFRGIEDWVLDQYRATITNILDMSNLPYYIDGSFWNTSKPRSDYKYINFDFYAGYGITSLQMFSLIERQRMWQGRYTTIPDTSSYNQFFNYSLVGIHDAAQYSAKTLIECQKLLWDACTNRTFSYSTTSSSTNQIVQFLSAPDTYSEQVHKVSQSQNWLQRVELWLSAIAKNTYNSPEDKTDIPSDLDQERQQEANGITETVTNQFAYIHGEFNDLSNSSTNVFTVAARVVGDFTNCLHHFTMSTSPSRAGPSGSGSAAADRFAKMSVMEMSWFSSRLNELTNKGNNIPDHLMIQDKPSGVGKNTVWSTSLKMADIAHDVFGVLWVLVGFGMTILLCIHVTKTFILIWCMLLHYIPNIARYSLGS